MIRKAKESDLKPLISLYKEVFKVHNVFGRPEKDIEAYLKKFKNIIVAEEGGKIVGGLVIGKKDYRLWTLASIKHVAVAPAYQDKDIGTALLKKAEKIVRKGKIEINVGEMESGSLRFYEKNGYEKEAELKSHYRKGETCFVMGKVLE